MIEEWDLTATNLRRIRGRHYEVAVLPVGATEAHNLHLPEGTDVRHTTWVAHESCRKAWEEGAQVICLPTLPFGCDCNLLDFPLTIHVSQATLDAVITDAARSLGHHGIRKLVIVNGHGGNDFVRLVRETQCELDMHIFLCNWWMVGHDRYSDIFDEPDDHAGELETSVALALFPELVELERAGPGEAAPFALTGLQEGWIRTSRRFSNLNDHCAAGKPGKATADKGRAYLDLVCKRLSSFLLELSASEASGRFPQREDQ